MKSPRVFGMPPKNRFTPKNRFIRCKYTTGDKIAIALVIILFLHVYLAAIR